MRSDPDAPVPRPSGPDGALRRVLDAAGIPAATLDLEGRFTAVNPAFARACGRAVGELVGLHVLSLCPTGGELLTAVVHLVGGVTAIERSAVEVVAADGSVRDLLLTLGVAAGPDGPSAIHVVAEDVSARRREERRQERLPAPAVDDSPAAGEVGELTGAVLRSARTGAPWALLDCLVQVRDAVDRGDSDRDAAPPGDVVEAVTERVRQRLRPEDEVHLTGADRIRVVAEALGDVQDAAGVAYRLLAAVVEPVRTARGEVAVELTIGIAVADADADLVAVRDEAATALAAATTDGAGTFRLSDCRTIRV